MNKLKDIFNRSKKVLHSSKSQRVDVIIFHHNNNNSIMSIYSGLPTRKDEHNYNKLLSKLFLLLQEHVLELSKGFIDSKYIVQYSKVLARLKEL